MGSQRSIYLSPFIVITKEKEITYSIAKRMCNKCKRVNNKNTFCPNCGNKIETITKNESKKADFWNFIEEYDEAYDGIFSYEDYEDENLVFPNGGKFLKNITTKDLVDLSNFDISKMIEAFKLEYSNLINDLVEYFGSNNLSFGYGVINVDY